MDMLYIRQTKNPVEQVGAKLEQAAVGHHFSVLGVINLKEKMAAKGIDFEPQCRVYEVCNPHQAKEVLEGDLRISTALPCRISVYEEGGATHVATILPTALLNIFHATDLWSVANQVEGDIKAIIDDAIL